MCPVGTSQALPVASTQTFLRAHRGSPSVKFTSQLCIADSFTKGSSALDPCRGGNTHTTKSKKKKCAKENVHLTELCFVFFLKWRHS